MKYSVMTLVSALFFCSCSYTPNLKNDSVEDVLKAMTLEEKAHIVVGMGNAHEPIGGAVIGSTYNIVPGAAGTTYPIPRLGIPSIVLADGPAGLRIDPTRDGDSLTYYCTHFPIGTLLASTWDVELVEKVGKAMGNEVLEYGADVLLAPGVNIHRNPLNGRNFEYYSEDPIVTSEIAAAYINGIQSNGVGTSIKHFAANNQETNRTATDAIVSERALREIYLRGFERAIKKSSPWTIMTSYNYLNGVYTSENPELLMDLLRDDWGYEGMVVTDWFGGSDPVAQLKAGNNMIQPGKAEYPQMIIDAVNNGSLDIKVLDREVSRVLGLIKKSQKVKEYAYSNKPDLKAHANVTRESATNGMVLLKNEKKTLPLQNVNNIALFGSTSYDFIAGGTGSGNVNRAYVVSLTDGLGNAGYQIDNELKIRYQSHITQEKERIENTKKDSEHPGFLPLERPTEIEFSIADIKASAAGNDAAVITIGRITGEFFDRTTDNFNLTASELTLIKNVSEAYHAVGKPVVVILNVGGVVETASWKGIPDAILCAWQGGQEGGNSVADILKGNVSPSGKLTMTFPNKLTDVASSHNFPINRQASLDLKNHETAVKHDIKNVDYTNYEEDIYVGYRYFDTFDKDVSYPFGYGLSYADFEYSNPSVKKDGDKVTVTVDVKNIGSHAGKEVVQLYAIAPDATIVNRPEKELKSFAKTKELVPGELQTLTLELDVNDLAWFNEAKSSWDITEGDYQLLIGSSSRDIRSKVAVKVNGKSTKSKSLLKPKYNLNRIQTNA